MELYLSFGSNLGDRKYNILKASELLCARLDIRMLRFSDIIETEPWGFESQDSFLNAVGVYEIPEETCDYAYKVLDEIKRIEREMGRDDVPEYDDKGKRIYHSRTIDIDILYLGGLKMDEKRLTIPHPLIEQRDFVKIPLRQVINYQ